MRTKCEYKRKLLEKHRGDWCLINFVDPATGTQMGGLCGCGSRHPPGIKLQRRIVRRLLQRDFSSIISEEGNENRD